MAGSAQEDDTEAAAALDDSYKWSALANTTAATFMAVLDGSIVIIALPAIFRGIHLDPLAPGNIAFLLWMIMGYRLVQAVFVVTLGRLGDMYGRVRIYNAGFAVFTVASVLLSIDPYLGSKGALWLIAWRFVQAIGGSMLMANSAAILTDAFPENQRGFALGINQVAGLSGQFIGLVAGGLLAAWDWRAVFWVNVPVGIFGTLWAYWRLREVGTRTGGRIDWWGNVTFAVGLGSILIAVTIGIQPYHGEAMGWTSPEVLALLFGGLALLIAFVVIESRVVDPLFRLSLFRIRAFAAGNVASFAARLGQGGLQFMLVIWLQGIWLPLHGYSYSSTPLWAGIFLLPLTAGFLLSGPMSGHLSDRYGARGFATTGMVVYGCSFIGLIFLPVNFSYCRVCHPHRHQRHRHRHVQCAQHVLDDEQRAGRVPGCGVGHAGHLPELGHGALHRRLLLADDHRPGQHAAQDALERPPASGCAGGRRPPRGGAAPGGLPLRRRPRDQPAAPPPVHGRRPAIAPVRRPARAHGQGVLPPSALGTVQPWPDHRLRCLGRPGLHLGHRLVDPRAKAKATQAAPTRPGTRTMGSGSKSAPGRPPDPVRWHDAAVSNGDEGSRAHRDSADHPGGGWTDLLPPARSQGSRGHRQLGHAPGLHRGSGEQGGRHLRHPHGP